ncbi:MAG: transglutaminase-like cysteine peptidase, partial [Candidatus Berkiella sp.]
MEDQSQNTTYDSLTIAFIPQEQPVQPSLEDDTVAINDDLINKPCLNYVEEGEVLYQQAEDLTWLIDNLKLEQFDKNNDFIENNILNSIALAHRTIDNFLSLAHTADIILEIEINESDDESINLDLLHNEAITLDAKHYHQYHKLSEDEVILTIQENANKTELQKVTAINNYFNRATYIDDVTNWGVDDYWATPREFITAGGGDCEDYAIAKYITLKDMGVPENKLYLTYCYYFESGHMFLSYLPTSNSSPLVLDNINHHLVPLNQRNDIQSVYSINQNCVWA